MNNTLPKLPLTSGVVWTPLRYSAHYERNTYTQVQDRSWLPTRKFGQVSIEVTKRKWERHRRWRGFKEGNGGRDDPTIEEGEYTISIYV